MAAVIIFRASVYNRLCPRACKIDGNSMTMRQAEKAFEPLGMSLGHDYMGLAPSSLSWVMRAR